MDPAATGEPQVRTIRNCVTEALFDLDPEANLIPRLAESWEQTDETTYVIKLRQGVKFHDGNPFDAEVVKFNLERMLNPETQNVWASEIAARVGRGDRHPHRPTEDQGAPGRVPHPAL